MKNRLIFFGAALFCLNVLPVSQKFMRIKTKLSLFVDYQAALQKSHMLYACLEEDLGKKNCNRQAILEKFLPKVRANVEQVSNCLARCSDHFSIKTRMMLEESVENFRMMEAEFPS